MTKTLEDLVVLDFSRVLAGPFCTMMLCDLGAKVIGERASLLEESLISCLAIGHTSGKAYLAGMALGF